jgi:hypothetical protein
MQLVCLSCNLIDFLKTCKTNSHSIKITVLDILVWAQVQIYRTKKCTLDRSISNVLQSLNSGGYLN